MRTDSKNINKNIQIVIATVNILITLLIVTNNFGQCINTNIIKLIEYISPIATISIIILLSIINIYLIRILFITRMSLDKILIYMLISVLSTVVLIKLLSSI